MIPLELAAHAAKLPKQRQNSGMSGNFYHPKTPTRALI